jgi:hypothetical protein
MKHLQLYIKSLNKRQGQNTVPVHLAICELPGLRTPKQVEAEKIAGYKKEYNETLRRYQKNKKNLPSMKGKEKSDMNKHLKSTKQHLDSLWFKIGDSDPSKRAMGFPEVNDAK